MREIEAIHFRTIRENPFKSHELGYTFKGLRSYHFDHKGKSYRIVYEVFEEEKLVVIIMIAPRESFYEKLSRRVWLNLSANCLMPHVYPVEFPPASGSPSSYSTGDIFQWGALRLNPLTICLSPFLIWRELWNKVKTLASQTETGGFYR